MEIFAFAVVYLTFGVVTGLAFDSFNADGNETIAYAVFWPITWVVFSITIIIILTWESVKFTCFYLKLIIRLPRELMK